MYFTSFENFEKLVDEGIMAIPEEFRKKFDNLDFVTYNFPLPHQFHKMNLRHPYQLLGLYEGIPITQRQSGYAGVIPDKISIFRMPIQMIARDAEHLKEIVKNTVWHEVAHHFGMNEDKVRSLEKLRGHKY